jgi:hypothetical protein
MITNIHNLDLRPGDILLTSGVGGTSKNWRDEILSNLILKHQKMMMQGFIPKHSHVELLTDTTGGTFAARWRTRHRVTGLLDYVGCNITIGRCPLMTDDAFYEIWAESGISKFDGNIYPIHRIVLQCVGTWMLPWVSDIGAGSFGVCSEVVSRFYHAAHKYFKALGSEAFHSFEGQWRGITPAHIEREVKHGDDWNVVFSGLLTQAIYEKLIGAD